MRKRRHNKTGRGSNALSDFIAIERYIVRSPAWQALTVYDRAAYFELGYRYTGTNNGAIQLSTRILADALNSSKATASRCLKQLTAMGFVEQAKGASFHSKIRHCAEWRLTAFRCDVSGGIPSKTFMRWQPQLQKSVSPENDTVSPEVPMRNLVTEKACDGFTSGTVKGKSEGLTVSPEVHIYTSTIGHTHSRSAVSAGTPHQGASAKRGDEVFISAGLAAIKSLQHLNASLPDDLKSWTTSSSPQKIARAA